MTVRLTQLDGKLPNLALMKLSHWSGNARELFAREFPCAQLGGTGTESKSTVEEITGDYEHYDYSIYPSFPHSIGFTQRGCRLNCSFCVVPKKEGRVKEVNSIADIWRGAPHPKNILLLDNDVFYRFNKMVELGLRPYPMVFDNSNKVLKKFQRWVLRRYYEFIEWENYA